MGSSEIQEGDEGELAYNRLVIRMRQRGFVAGETSAGTAHRMPVGQSSASARTRFAASLSLGIFMLALESERLSALMHVGGTPSVAPIQTSLVTLVFFIAGVVVVCLRPPHKPAPAAAICVVALASSLGVASLFFLQRASALFAIQFLGDLVFSLSPPVLIYFWLQRCMPFGKSFVIESFGMAAVTLGCLSILTIVLEHSVALILVALLPLVGAALLCTVEPVGACGGAAGAFAENGPRGHVGNLDEDRTQAGTRWSALRAMGSLARHDSEETEDASLGKLARNALVRLIPFFCYALLFGSVHFSWLVHQDEASVGMWVQLGASVGTILCGLAALALSRIRWGRALENITHLLLTAFAIVALWLSTFLASNYVFAYLVLLNIAQKLTFMLMLVFGFPFARSSSQRTSLWSIAYLSFFAGTCVSSLLGNTCTVTVLNIVCAAALAVLLLADIAGIAALYSLTPYEDSDHTAGLGTEEVTPKRAGTEGTAPNRAGIAGFASGETDAGASGTDGAHLNVEGTNGGMLADGTSSERSMDGGAATPRHDAQQPSNGFDQLPYTCHLIAVEYDLTRREEEILQLLVRGRTASRIAETLCITTATTRTHLRNIYAKLGVHSQQDILDMFEDFASRG